MQSLYSIMKLSHNLKDIRMIDAQYLLITRQINLNTEIWSSLSFTYFIITLPTSIQLLFCRVFCYGTDVFCMADDNFWEERVSGANGSSLNNFEYPHIILQLSLQLIQLYKQKNRNQFDFIATLIDNFIMSVRKTRHYYNTPLNTSKTIDLPSNLLQLRPNLRYQPPETPNMNATIDVTPRQMPNPIKNNKEENVMFVQEQQKNRKGVLYKRLQDIKLKNQQLEKYSYSKLLSKMVIIDPQGVTQPLKTIEPDNYYNYRSISEYSCLKGKLMNMQCEDEDLKVSIKPRQNETRLSSVGQYANRTTRIFKRFYMPNSEKANPNLLNQTSPEQKYIYINGKKTECKRIHNYYTSQNFRKSYDKAFGKTKDSFYQKKSKRRYQIQF